VFKIILAILKFQINGNSYFVYKSEVSYEEAVEKCSSQNLTLLSINDVNEHLNILQQLAKSGKFRIF